MSLAFCTFLYEIEHILKHSGLIVSPSYDFLSEYARTHMTATRSLMHFSNHILRLLIKMPKRQSERESGEGMLSTDLPLLDEIPKETEDVYKRKHR